VTASRVVEVLKELERRDRSLGLRTEAAPIQQLASRVAKVASVTSLP
jgi:hypothetical protein